MYQSTRAQLLNAEKDAINNKRIGNEINQMIRNQMLMQGITPITVEQEKPSIEQERDYIMSLLKGVTTQPSKFYDYLYRTNQITDFSLGINEFIKKKLRYKRNLPYSSLIKEWEAYKSGSLEVTPLQDIRSGIYNKIVQPRIQLNKIEQEQRNEIEKEENESRERKEDIYKINTELAKRKPPPPPPMPKKLKIPESNISPLSSIDRLMEELKDKIQHRKIEGIGIKSRKRNRVRVINDKVIYPIGYQWDWR